MRIEVALSAADGVGEGPFWDEAEQALWWVDIAGRSVQRWQPATGDHRRWPMPDFPSAVVLREQGGLLLAMRDGLYFMDPVTGALELFCAPDAERPDNRSNEAKCGPTGDFWLGTMDNNLHPDGSPREMTQRHAAPSIGCSPTAPSPARSTASACRTPWPGPTAGGRSCSPTRSPA